MLVLAAQAHRRDTAGAAQGHRVEIAWTSSGRCVDIAWASHGRRVGRRGHRRDIAEHRRRVGICENIIWQLH
eukprot:3583866-Lingulodinium_polyedra.AAC.1